MNPKHLSVRMDRTTGNLVLTHEHKGKPVRRVVDITSHIYLAMCADLHMVEGTNKVERDIQFADGSKARITVELLEAPALPATVSVVEG